MVFSAIDSCPLVSMKRLDTMKVHLDKVVNHLFFVERSTISNGRCTLLLGDCRLPRCDQYQEQQADKLGTRVDNVAFHQRREH
jgi:hypothetical protein